MKKITIFIIFIFLSSIRLLGHDFRFSSDSLKKTYEKSISISKMELVDKKLTISCLFSGKDLSYILHCKKSNIFIGSGNKFYPCSLASVSSINDSINMLTMDFSNYIDTLDKLDLFSDCDTCFYFKGIRLQRSYDVLAQEDGSIIKAILLDVGVKMIKYKKFNTLDDSIFSIPRDEIVCIKYRFQQERKPDQQGKIIGIQPQMIPDIIMLFNKAEINAVVVKVDTIEIKYKKFNYPDGPTFSVLRKDVHLIQYSNGQTQILNSNEDHQASLNKSDIPPEINTSDYGGLISLGASIGGGALLGIPMRFYPGEQVAFDLTLGVRPIITNGGTSNISYDLNFFYAGDLDLYFTKIYKPKSGKVNMNGIFISGGNSTGHKYEESFYAAGWAYEHYKNEKQSFTIKLGLGSITLNENHYMPYYYYYPYTTYVAKKDVKSLLIFWKFGWNFFW